MLLEKGAGGRLVKIMDFGLAHLTGQSQLTQKDTSLGTPAYMSPGQAEGGRTDHRTDIWSLGVVLYEMIVGQMPFKGEYQQAVIYSILHEDYEPVTALRAGVPMELEWIVGKCLEKDPGPPLSKRGRAGGGSGKPARQAKVRQIAPRAKRSRNSGGRNSRDRHSCRSKPPARRIRASSGRRSTTS